MTGQGSHQSEHKEEAVSYRLFITRSFVARRKNCSSACLQTSDVLACWPFFKISRGWLVWDIANDKAKIRQVSIWPETLMKAF